jgi:transcription-repair coupling factor (superfamily II helicase)
MLLKIDLRAMQLRQLDGGTGRVVVTLGADARLDGARVATLVHKSRGLYRLTPELKLVAKVDASVKGVDFIPAARKVLRDLMACAVDDGSFEQQPPTASVSPAIRKSR